MTTEFRTTVSAGAGTEFVISDGSRDRHGTRLNPGGWDLANFLRNPVALFAHGRDATHGTIPIGTWSDVRIAGGKLLGKLVFAAQGTSARIDELRSLAEQGILRAVSVGFTVLEEGKRGGEYDYEKMELHEVSLVSIPSNTNALSKARSLGISDETISLAFGEHAEAGRRDVPTGENAASLHPVLKGPKMDSLTKRIEHAQHELNSARDALTAHINDENADADQTEALASEIDVREQRLTSLERAEKALATRAAPLQPVGQKTTVAVRRPLGVQMREPKPEDLIIRAAVVKILSHVTGREPERILEERYPDHEATHVVTRAAVDGAKTTTTGWAAELVDTAMGAFMETLRPISVYPRLASLGTSLTFGPNSASIKLPSRAATPSISGSFVAEGAPIPVRRLGLTSITLSPHKMGVISVFSRELARYSNPQIEGLLRQEITADTALTIDTLLLDAVAGSATRPAGLVNGVTGITASAAGGYGAILADIAALAAPFDTANSGRRLVLLMNPAEARMVAMAPGPDGQFGWADQFLGEFERIVSTTVPAGHVYMIDAADFATAAGDAPEFETSEQAVLHMEDTTPLQISAVGTPNTVAAPAQSMFQTAQIALRMILDITWAMRRTGMVQHIAAVDWAPN
ncbi:phage major capsid protein [Aureimonas glaciei]|uniref:Phage capsid-like C-terminal domain-containing protein n=1 Tax=Aureimonas glaciei TaxID=1776957 RepID=A0A916Y501_9HYPH|nr:phage major capsid protein [Aureimonas glaciei]GGD30840.1 hypothetical protein GCM10011335_37340 [Aureimonas glaciei]